MSDNAPLSSGWTNVDDEAPSVRVSEVAAAEKQAPAVAPQMMQEPERVSAKKTEASIAPNSGAMRLSAFAGIAIVLVFGTLYVGIDNLRGSLTDGNASDATITITQDGHFDPASVTVTAGGNLTIENKNSDPQVIKVKEGSNELFPVQVLFEKPYVFVVPNDAAGIFTYISETLPNGEQVEITVQPAIEASAVTETEESTVIESGPPIEDMDGFPLPFGGPVVAEPEPMPAAPVTLESVPVIVEPLEAAHTVHDNTAEEISIGEAKTDNAATFSSGEIPTNPFTVAAAGKRGNAGSRIANNAKNLHSGAPLLQMRRRPESNASTGPASWGVFIGSIVLMFAVYRAAMMKIE